MTSGTRDRPNLGHAIRSDWLGVSRIVAWVAVFAAPAGRTGELLATNAWAVLADLDGYRAVWRTPQAGEWALTQTAMEIVHLLRTAEARSYRYSDGVAGDELVRQRVLEGAWPIRYDAGSGILVALRDEPVECPIHFTTEAAKLARCD